MQFNSHIEKYKASDAGGIHAEQYREYKNSSRYHNNVDPTRTDLNVVHEYQDWKSAIRTAQQRQEQLTGKAVRKDAVVLCSSVQSVPASWGREAAMDYFQAYEGFMLNFLNAHGCDQGVSLSAITHYDEDNPHQTYTWMPLKDGKFKNKEIMNKQFLRDLQKEGWEHYQTWALQHPELEQLEPYQEGGKRVHKSELEFKQQTLNEIEQKAEDIINELTELKDSAVVVLKEFKQEQLLNEREEKVLEAFSERTIRPLEDKNGNQRLDSKNRPLSWIQAPQNWMQALLRVLKDLLQRHKQREMVIERANEQIKAIEALSSDFDRKIEEFRGLVRSTPENALKQAYSRSEPER